MTRQVIPAGAVEAALRAWHKWPDGVSAKEQARNILEAAAPHMLATVDTREELEALWLGSVVFSEGTAYQRYGNDDWTGEGRSFDGSQIALPATVLHDARTYRPTP